MLGISHGVSELFSNRYVQAIILSSIFLQVGIWVRNFAILLFVMDQTGNNPVAVSLISVAEYAPIFIFSLVGGTFADRWKPRNTMIWCDFLSAASVFFVLITIKYGSWQAIFFVTLISTILSQFSWPSGMKLFKKHIPKNQLQTGMAMYQTFLSSFMIFGPMLGTLVYQKYGINVSIAVMGIAFLFSAVVLLLIPPDEKMNTHKVEADFWKELKDGLFYVWQKKVLSTLGVVFVFAGSAVGIVQTLGIFIIIERLGLPKEYFQWILVVNGVAMLIGGVIVMGLAKKYAPQTLLTAALLINAFNVIGIALSTNWYLTLVLQFFNGLFMPCFHIGINTLILKNTEEEFVGRVNGILMPIFIGAMVITMSLAGWLKVHFSLVPTYVAAGLLFVIGLLISLRLLRLAANLKQETTISV
jgi:MFS family permease